MIGVAIRGRLRYWRVRRSVRKQANKPMPRYGLQQEELRREYKRSDERKIDE